MEIIWPVYPVDADQFRMFLLYYLNRVYCAKSHLLERLPEIVEQTNFKDLSIVIYEVIKDLEKQLTKLEEIYNELDSSSSLEDCNYIISFLEEAFADIQRHSNDPIRRDMAILFYVENVESLEMSSFKIMIMLSIKLKHSIISQLLKESFDQAKEASQLLRMISAKYLMY